MASSLAHSQRLRDVCDGGGGRLQCAPGHDQHGREGTREVGCQHRQGLCLHAAASRAYSEAGGCWGHV